MGGIDTAARAMAKKAQNDIAGVVLGAIPNGTITEAKLDATLISTLANPSPTNSVLATVNAPVTSLPSTVVRGQLDATVKGNTYVNMLGVAGDCESLTGWSALNGASLTLDTSNKVFGSNSLKYQHNANNSGGTYKSVTKLINSAKCYMLSSYVKTDGTSSSGLRMSLNDNAYSTIGANSSFFKATTWTRICVKIQSSDFSGKDLSVARIWFDDIDTNQVSSGYIDGVMLNEITQSEYDTLTTAQLLDKYPYVNGVYSCDKVRVRSCGKNLFNINNVNDVTNGATYSVQDNNSIIVSSSASATNISANYIFNLKSNTTYFLSFSKATINSSTGNTGLVQVYKDGSWIMNISSGNSFTTNALGGSYRFKFMITDATAGTASIKFSNIQLEEGNSATSYEPFKSTESIAPVMLRNTGSVYDTFDCNSGIMTKNISDWVSLDGSLGWGFNGDKAGWKEFNIVNLTNSKVAEFKVVKHNNTQLTYANTPLADECRFSGSGTAMVITVSDSDTGLLDAWDGATSFTGMTIVNLIKAYMNGWKLTTADVDVANCIWTGIASGTTKTGSSGYTFVTTAGNIDVGFTPYRMIYQYAQPQTTYYYPSTLIAEVSGNVVVEPFVSLVGYYSASKITIDDSTKPISSLAYVNKINVLNGVLTPIPLTSCTVAADGLTFTISGAVNSEYYDYGFNYESKLSTVPYLDYTYNTNLKAQVNNNTDMLVQLDKEIRTIQAVDSADDKKAKFTPEGGFALKLTNKTGAVSVKGTVVSAHTTVDNAVELQSDEFDSIGIVYESGIVDGGEVWVVVSGIAEVLLKDTTASTRGNWVIASDTDGRADATQPTPTPGNTLSEHTTHFKEIGHCIESKIAGTGVIAKCVLHFN